MNWQPIETAPKDGSRILVRTTGKVTLIAHYGTGAECWRNDWGDQCYPFVWMPLPEPPK